jgi:HAMP domain-containing protein
VLLTGWLILAAASGLVGILLAKRMLAPVSRASVAAQSLAEGLPETRLPVETQDEFGILAMSFNDGSSLTDKITELSEARETRAPLHGQVAHELRTPVGALVGEASLVRDQLEDIPGALEGPSSFSSKTSHGCVGYQRS